MDALLVVDIQKSCVTDQQRYRYSEVLTNINKLIEHFRSKQLTVIHIQHQDDSAEYRKGSRGWEFADELDVDANDIIITKSYCDAFIQTDLNDTLIKYDSKRIFVVGCATDFCVDSTIKGAIAKGFDLVIPSDAHSSSDRPHLLAKDLIKHFNWHWENLIIGKQKISVLPTYEAMNLTTDNSPHLL